MRLYLFLGHIRIQQGEIFSRFLISLNGFLLGTLASHAFKQLERDITLKSFNSLKYP